MSLLLASRDWEMGAVARSASAKDKSGFNNGTPEDEAIARVDFARPTPSGEQAMADRNVQKDAVPTRGRNECMMADRGPNRPARICRMTDLFVQARKATTDYGRAMRKFLILGGLAVALAGSAVAAAVPAAGGWLIGPIIKGRNYSPGMAPRPSASREGLFEIELPEAPGSVHYVTFRHGSLAGKRRIVLRYRIEVRRARGWSRPRRLRRRA